MKKSSTFYPVSVQCSLYYFSPLLCYLITFPSFFKQCKKVELKLLTIELKSALIPFTIQCAGIIAIAVLSVVVVRH